MTQYPASRPAPKSSSSSGGIDLKTLWITAASSAAAAYACSKIWTAGTLAAAAFTPVLVAIIREGLSKSTEVVTRAVPPVRGVVRGARPAQPPSEGRPREDAGLRPVAGEPAATSVADEGAAMRVAQPGEITYHGSSSRGRGWRVAIVTGLLGFVIAAVVFTVPELVSGSSAAGGGRDTTLFGGRQHRSSTPAVTTTTDTTTTPQTRTQTLTVPPEKTVTVPPPAVTTTTPTTTAPVPQQQAPATTVPPTTTPPPVAEPPPVGEPPPPG